MKLISLSCSVATLLAAGTAFAEAPGSVQTVLPNILSTADGATIDIRLDYTNVQDDNGPTIFALNLHGQYITPGGIGGYIALPYGYAEENSLFGDRSVSGIGNLELGGLYVIRNSPDLDLYLRGGFSIDTADQDGGEEAVVPIANIAPRPADWFTTGFGTEWFRGHFGLRSKGPVTFGGSAGLDLALDNDDDGVLVLAGSVGLVQQGFAISGGLTLLQAVGDEADNDDDSIVSFNATVDFDVGPKAKLFGALGANLEDEFDAFSLGFGVLLGL
jgi:opacity protein-like surface antigen